MSIKRWLFVCRKPPYASGLPRAGLDMALAAAAFEQEVALLFMGDGIWQLVKEQHGGALGQKDFDRQLSALPLYGVEELHVEAAALSQRLLAPEDLVLPVTTHDADSIARLLTGADRVFDF